MTRTEDVTIRELRPELLDDYLAFFDGDAFADNPHWASCYCYFNQAPHATEKWDERTGEQNRAAASQLIRAGLLHGYLAYVDGKPVGWCNANLRKRYTILDQPEQPEPELTGAIVCFIIARSYRRQGLARRLLQAAMDGFRRQGIEVIEAFPRKEPKNEYSNYHGPLFMYLQAGFEPVGEEDGSLVVRKQL